MRKIILALVLLLYSILAFSQPVPQATAVRTSLPIKLDGEINVPGLFRSEREGKKERGVGIFNVEL